MTAVKPQIEAKWGNALEEEFNSDYFRQLKEFLVEEKKNHTIYPPGSQIFSAFDHTPFDKVKVVIIGQDPYHGPGQANGLCFSVSPGIKPPPSLVNIYKELHSDLGIPIPNTGNLEPWADQGVLLLNATLTVRAKKPASHQNKGWETFTDAAIKKLSQEKAGLVFILWGKYAQSKEALINSNKHLILKSPHPSPYSANYGFFSSKPFSKTNEYLKAQGKEPIDWRLPESQKLF